MARGDGENLFLEKKELSPERESDTYNIYLRPHKREWVVVNLEVTL